MYLNPVLYNLLLERFRFVHVANQGENLIGSYKYDPIHDRTVLDIEYRGETYCVNCPYCRETRQRLYINHRYGTYDDISQSHNTHMVRCFNEECFKKDPTLFKDLYDRIFGMRNTNQRGAVSYLRGTSPTVAVNELTDVSPPGEVVPLYTLPVHHQANQYLLGRGYNLQELNDRWQLMYCIKADDKYKPAQDRIIIPIIQEEKWCGWAARQIGDLDWKAHKIPKYYNLPSMPKRLILYNHDVAIKQDFIVITEGPTSCWSVWPYGVAILGKQATIQQQRLLTKYAKEKPLIILLDADATADANRLHHQLKPYAPKGLVSIHLPDKRDPGSYAAHTDELWDIIKNQALGQGLEIKLD